MTTSLIERLRSIVAKRGEFSVAESFELAAGCARLLGSKFESDGRDIVIRALDASERLPVETVALWNDLVEAAGLYPYVDRGKLSGSGLLRYEAHASRYLSGIVLHREQVSISDLLGSGRGVILSAPTSFGKSLLIQEVVASKAYDNIVIVQPTLALLDETRKKLQQYGNEYRIVVSTSQDPSEGRNIFLFTGERVVEYEKFPKLDFFVVDEFYKLSMSREDERAITLNQALYKLLKNTKKFYLLGPSINGVTDAILERTGAAWVKSDYATVAVDISVMPPPTKVRGMRQTAAERERKKERQLFQLLDSLVEPTMIYCSAPEKAARLALSYARTRNELSEESGNALRVARIQEWISENIHQKWALNEALGKSVGFHHGAIPRHLGSSIVDAFNDGGIKHLFCTSTLIEGVNTTARNVVLYDDAKGRKPIDYFDYKNIVGRSGRMKIHFVGRVFQFVQRPAQIEMQVDVPLFDQASAPLELLLQIDGADLDSAARDRVNSVGLDEDPELATIIKRNTGVSLEGQLALYKVIERDADRFHELLGWSTIPKYPEIRAVVDLIWEFLIKPGESKSGISPGQLAMMAIQYASTKSVRALIDENVNSSYWVEKIKDEDVRVQKVVHLVLNTLRQWFEYKLPKVLGAVSSLQALALSRQGFKPGNYSYLCALLENSAQRSGLAVLLDYDVPMSAIRKIEREFSGREDWLQLLSKLRKLDFKRYGLLAYEIEKIVAMLAVPPRLA